MGLRLRPDLLLEPVESEGHVLLQKRGTGAHAGTLVFRLHPLQGLVMALLDGRRTRADLQALLTEVLECPAPAAETLVSAVFGRYRQFIVDAPGGDAEPPARDPADFFFPARRDLRLAREPAPAALTWVVTESCDKRCGYCYKDAAFVADGRAPDMTLPFDRVRELVAEAADVGVRSMILTGGEPLLRPDLVEIVGLLVAHGLDVVLITKGHMAGQRMRALAATGLERLHVSLDSHRPETVDRLTGVPGSFERLLETVSAAVECGLRVVLRPLLTSVNVRDFEELAALGARLGVAQVLPDIYGETCGRHDPAFTLSAEDRAWLRTLEPLLARRHPQLESHCTFNKPAGAALDGLGCVEAARGLTLLPDGRATKCERWRFGDELILGDLKVQSLMEVWRAPSVERLLAPGREAFAGTACHHCRHMDHCNERRGRCTLSALLAYGTPFAPDCYCPLGAFKKPQPRASPPAP